MLRNRKKCNFNRNIRTWKLTRCKLYHSTHNQLCRWDAWHYRKLGFKPPIKCHFQSSLFYLLPWELWFSKHICNFLENYSITQLQLCYSNWLTNKIADLNKTYSKVSLLVHKRKGTYFYLSNPFLYWKKKE